jgi:pyruvate-formate lyase-activating enzyme
MSAFNVLEPAIDPNNRISFLLDWELTMKCNLDCSYCETGIYGSHDNSTKHPPLKQCLLTVDFMFAYVDAYMQQKPRGIKHVILNVYGGESLHHPNIAEVLQACHNIYQAQYQSNWRLTITTTTNAIVSDRILQSVIPLIDEFTCSYHAESTAVQKEQFKKNVLAIKSSGKQVKCVLLMHPEPKLFSEVESMIEWCQQHDVKQLPRQLDHFVEDFQFNYKEHQVTWFKDFYQKRSYQSQVTVPVKQVDSKFDLADSGRACCGGRQLCTNQNQKERHFFVENKFPDWYCSVNHFFLYIKQITGEIFVNKDCKMNFNGSVGPIGHLDNTEKLLFETRQKLINNTLPIIQCKKSRCVCGLCAPKAQTLENYNSAMKKYQL